jgi:hypothetical protein
MMKMMMTKETVRCKYFAGIHICGANAELLDLSSKRF